MNLLIKQYKTIKEKYRDAILLFRVGDFYETFNEDAQIVGSQMDILVTVGDENSDVKKKASVPFYSLDLALRLLTKSGYKVAVCEQLEAPKPGHMKRGVTDIH